LKTDFRTGKAKNRKTKWKAFEIMLVKDDVSLDKRNGKRM
jgi:hypothetical protein